MKKTILFVFFGIVILISISVFLLILTIKSSKNCNQFVIDTYELASGIDIPKVSEADCYLDKESKIRTGIYLIDTTVTAIPAYIEKFGLKKIRFGQGILWNRAYLKSKEATVPLEKDELFIAERMGEGGDWQCVLDKNTGRLWFEIRWHD